MEEFIIFLRSEFKRETGCDWQNSQGEPDIEYVQWLEQKIKKEKLNK